MRRQGAITAAAVLFACAALAGTAHASPEDVANSIAAEIMSPFCPGVTLENCPSDRAVELRARIESWAADGWDEERILTELEGLYGQSIRALPRPSGSGLGAWAVPIVALVAGIGVAAYLARRWTRGRPEAVAVADIPPETRTRIDEELDALRARP
ncbi:MAG TPA: cytochrome c-type biogenesis protein CcmH [Actinomycetota bacterium]|jgi:cytochrome c-type biogenesis protein CcmH/NrfF